MPACSRNWPTCRNRPPSMIYLDYNATAPMRPSVVSGMAALLGEPLNTSSVHSTGQKAKKLLEDARSTIAQALSAFPNEVLFTASATEANNMVLRAFADSHALLVSAVEHPSVGKLGKLLGADTLAVDANGVVKLDLLEAKLRALGDRKALISIMLANNETGVIQPIAEVAQLARTYGALVHTDAVQALGKIRIDWGLLGVDMLTVSGHKAGGPVGAGALLIRNDLPIRPMLVGGGQELGRRAGTSNIAAIHGFAQAVREVASCAEAAQWRVWREQLEAELSAAGAVVYGAKAERLPNVLNLGMAGVGSDTQLMNFDIAGFAVSAGSACSSGKVEPSPVLVAMGVAPDAARMAIRVSFGWASTQADIDAFAAAWKQLAARLVKQAA